MAQLRRWPSADTLDVLFLKHYATLVARAQQLVGRDVQAAEDLVHDAYVRLALRQFDASAVQNLDAYFFVTLRNVHLSQVRRRMSKSLATVSIIDHESIVSGLRSLVHDEERHSAHDELRHVVRYACLRKATSKAASVLILRYFHGYHAAEIARVVQTSDAAVAGRLSMARAEARAYVADPRNVRWLDDRRAPVQRKTATTLHDETALVASLRQAIFDACTGTCVSRRACERIYADRRSDPIDVATLAHVVSCAACLDAVNRQLGLPRLAERDPSDSLGRGPTNMSGGSGGRGGTSGGNGAGRADVTSTLRTRLEDARQNHPHELQIAVNGLFVGSQAVNGPVNEQRLKILLSEQVGFIEIFDEYGACLLYLDVEPPPSGAVEQTARVTLSDGRQLSATLTFSELSPTAHVVYEDPEAAAPAAVVERVDDVAREMTSSASSKWRWSLWPPLRFVVAGIILGLLLANARPALAAVDYVRRALVDSIARLIETVRPRAVLPSRSLSRALSVTPLAPPAVNVSLAVSTRTATVAEGISDVELSELTLGALRALDDAGALTREQIGVERGPDRRLHVTGVVADEARRRELVAALHALPARVMRVELATPGDGGSPSQQVAPLRSAELASTQEPAAYPHLRRSLPAHAATATSAGRTAGATNDGDVREPVRRLAASLLARSLQARIHGRTVRELVARVPAAEARQLSPAALATWRQLVRRHAELLRLETASLRRDIDNIFPSSAPDAAAAPATLARDGDVWEMAWHLFALASAHDLAVRNAFAVVAAGSASLEVSTPAFRQSLVEAETLVDALLAKMPVRPGP